MQINEKQIATMYRVMANQHCRNILKILGENSGKTFTEIGQSIGVNTSNKQTKIRSESDVLSYKIQKKKQRSGLLAHEIKLLTKARLIKLDKNMKRYFLTRYGVRMLEVIENFESICIEYDMNDCDADGKVRLYTIVEGRKL